MNEKELIENINILTEAVSGLLTANESLSQRVYTLESTNHELMRRSEILRRIVDNIPYELAGGNQLSDIHDPVYRSQIIANLSS